MTDRMQVSLPDRRRSLLRGLLGAALLTRAGWGLAGGRASTASAGASHVGASGVSGTQGGAGHHAVSGGTRAGHAPRRIVSMGGTLTEIIYALGAGDQLVGTDASSLYPPEARQLPQVGYYRGFSVEGVASLHPDLVIAAAESGPPQALDGLKKLGIPLELIALKPDLDHLVERITELAKVLDRKPEGEALVKKLRRQVADATRIKRPARVVALSNHVGRMQGAIPPSTRCCRWWVPPTCWPAATRATSRCRPRPWPRCSPMPSSRHACRWAMAGWQPMPRSPALPAHRRR
ncbi:MAG: hypothetical protein D8H96_17285 [Lautropia sp.]|nr:MAG: hypothetical protein D8H96_17285 [Lautropia sp.]